MKILVVGLGYVGLSNAVLLARHHEVVGVDISQDKVNSINLGNSPFHDNELSEYLSNEILNFRATTNPGAEYHNANYIIIATPTNYNPDLNLFDTSSIEKVLTEIISQGSNATVVLKSTVPIGYTEKIKKKFQKQNIIFSPEFLREGSALYDNLYPSRIVVGEKSHEAKQFADLLRSASLQPNTPIILTGSKEAESLKLFANSYLAMRVAFFNELDTFSMINNMDAKSIIEGVSLDPRIGNFYNNPSFGYGGYCLPKDTKQLLADFRDTPQNIVSAIVASNETRKKFLVDYIKKLKPKSVGIYRLVMKHGSDNFRESSVQDLILGLKNSEIDVQIFEPNLKQPEFLGCPKEDNLETFKENSELIVANRLESDLKDVSSKVFSRDLFQVD